MNITIIGAGGAVGRQIAQMIVAERLLECDERLMLVGNAQGASAKSLQGYAVDLMDAYAEICPRIDVVCDPDEVSGDIIVMAGGATLEMDPPKGQPLDRDSLARHNLPIFERYASAIKKNGHGHEIVICVSNPNELAVARFARHLGRKRVIGMGAFLDSWRFRQEIAHDLGVQRQLIHGFMIGEHGSNIVPLWSSIHIYGYNPEELAGALQEIRRGHKTSNYPADCAEVGGRVRTMVLDCEIRQAYDYIAEFPPDIRVALKPLITHLSGARTSNGTARVTLAMLQMIVLGSDALVAGQIVVEGDFHGISSTIGVPFVIGNRGVDRIIQLPLDEDEEALLVGNAEKIQQKLDDLFAEFDAG